MITIIRMLSFIIKHIILLVLLRYRFCINSDINEVYIEQTHNNDNNNTNELSNQRKLIIKASMKSIWNNYYLNGFGKDEFRPITNDGIDNWGSIGLTMIDSLDTLWIMEMFDEFKDATSWIKFNQSFNKLTWISVFETTIRGLGGLLSAYELSNDEIFLIKATELGHKLVNAFDTPTGIAYKTINYQTGYGNRRRSGDISILSELGGMQLEFRSLAYLLKDPTIESRAMKGIQYLANKTLSNYPNNGLYPSHIANIDGSFANKLYSFGAGGDSFYEYLLKTWLQGNRKETWLRNMYDNAIDGMIDNLLNRTIPSNYIFLSQKDNIHKQNSSLSSIKMDHLTCFMPGLLTLGAYTNLNGINSIRSQRDMKLAKELIHTCYQMYHKQITKLSPESIIYKAGYDFIVNSDLPYYKLRPEVIESLYILYHFTKDRIYQEWTWEIYLSINSYCKTLYGYGTLKDVRFPKKGIDNQMESFFLSETLKYLYLIYNEDTSNKIDFSKYIFTTEAHLLRIFDEHHIPI